MLVVAFGCFGARQSLAIESQDVSPDWRVRVQVVPPFGRVVFRRSGVYPLSLGRLALGLRGSSGWWGEAAIGAPPEGGWNAGVLAGATLGRTRPVPDTWQLTTPVFLGYRYERRPTSFGDERDSFTERTSSVVFGARELFTRWAAGGNGLELGLEVAGLVPFTRQEIPAVAPSDPVGHYSFEASIVIGWLLRP